MGILAFVKVPHWKRPKSATSEDNTNLMISSHKYQKIVQEQLAENQTSPLNRHSFPTTIESTDNRQRLSGHGISMRTLYQNILNLERSCAYIVTLE